MLRQIIAVAAVSVVSAALPAQAVVARFYVTVTAKSLQAADLKCEDAATSRGLLLENVSYIAGSTYECTLRKQQN